MGIMSKKLAIRGHSTRGKEVIKLLEMMGGDNIYSHWNGDQENMSYFINGKGNIDNWYLMANCNNYEVFTLEEFLEKYPFKVGDKVFDKVDGDPGIITVMKWDEDVSDMKYHVAFDNGDMGWYTNDTIGFLKCERTREDIDMNTCKDTERDIHKKITYLSINNEDYADQIEIDLGDNYEYKFEMNRLYIIKKKPKYPKTYEECCNVMYGSGANTYGKCIIKVNDGYKGSLIQSFQRLIFYRNTYWKIAGEEMGLGKPWKPDWKNGAETKYTIVYSCSMILNGTTNLENKILAFPTVEMRNAFYENFKDLIETCKELL